MRAHRSSVPCADGQRETEEETKKPKKLRCPECALCGPFAAPQAPLLPQEPLLPDLWLAGPSWWCLQHRTILEERCESFGRVGPNACDEGKTRSIRSEASASDVVSPTPLGYDLWIGRTVELTKLEITTFKAHRVRSARILHGGCPLFGISSDYMVWIGIAQTRYVDPSATYRNHFGKPESVVALESH